MSLYNRGTTINYNSTCRHMLYIICYIIHLTPVSFVDSMLNTVHVTEIWRDVTRMFFQNDAKLLLLRIC